MMRGVGFVLVVMACGALTACASAHAGQAQNSDAASNANSVSVGVPVPGDGNVHLTDYTDSDSTTSSVILSGAVGDYGSAKRDDGDNQLELNLSRGTLRLDTADLDRQFLARMRHLAVNQHSCSAEATASGRAPIVTGSGTGAYSAVRGTFELSMTLDEVYHPGACRETAPYLAQKIIVAGWGNISDG
jgi:hypothetical protein